jgi:hypothetical protein
LRIGEGTAHRFVYKDRNVARFKTGGVLDRRLSAGARERAGFCGFYVIMA